MLHRALFRFIRKIYWNFDRTLCWQTTFMDGSPLKAVVLPIASEFDELCKKYI